MADPNLKLINFSIQHEEQILKKTIYLNSKIKLIDAVYEVLQEVGKVHPLDNNPNNYAIYISKKNGLPKLDFPSYQKDIILEETGNSNFSLVHITLQNTNSPENSTHNSQENEGKQNDGKQKKKLKNWFLNLLGCS
ncbi:unnamed protein product (macronuclear) [Paramecium tetraurelia]|uniref:Ras-associating domain-containing protein n=1 Tax=Paramecium tetraurelia TaxID=5888 RepID=A0BJ04_PARTE|nr:uncharacterized protein GSPATT00004894001 [Paramecium tetraurelia]CAK58521.1 unnamed protein product [Paramecium tetraurelia]|eukprot:XP_001425919.1 hypothetical protein (macronuclear) [Paramecium tetraurelia strain d4-2]